MDSIALFCDEKQDCLLIISPKVCKLKDTKDQKLKFTFKHTYNIFQP